MTFGFYDALKHSYNLTEVNFGSRSPDKTCANARTFIYNQLAKAIHDGFYVDTSKYFDIFEALKATSYFINNSGQKALLPKDEVKKIIGHSPDATDALALTFYEDLDTSHIHISHEQQQDYINIFFR